MKNPECTSSETLATAAQAQELLIQAGTTAVRYGEKRYDRYTHTNEGILLPEALEAHMPDASVDTLRISDSVDVQWTFNPKTGEQKDAGIVAIVAFSREDKRLDGQVYITNVSYSVYRRGANDLTIERLVVHGEHGLPTVQGNLARVATESITPLAAWTEEIDRSEMPIAMQRKLGLLDVPASEANAVINLVSNIAL